RRYGSGTVSGTGVYYHVSRPAVVAVGVLDIAKVWLPTWLGLRWGLGLGAALVAGLAAMIGHNWPVYLRFHGGRGHSSIIGIMLAVFPWGFPWLLAFMALGRLMGQTALFSLLGIATLLLLVAFTGQPTEVIWATVAMLAITLAKRLEANRRPLPPPGLERRRVLLRRLLFDRDVGVREAWDQRTP
ncbi:MAG: glycerol-3-phosphate acyltransferase, partial [Anaerolineae bacterium]|nr:glycerol-3-phosphate acyltransferase [Anaerolineae bacterium]